MNSNKFYRIGILTVLLLWGCLYSFSQNCRSCENKCITPEEKGFVKSGLSRTIKIRNRQKYSFNLNLLEDKEYFISVYGKESVGNVQVKIFSSNDKKLMYDNAASGFENTLSLKSDFPQTLIVEISAPEGKFFDHKIECLGIYVASKK